MTTDRNYCITLEDVKEAADRLRGDVIRTPVMRADFFDENDKELFFKVEAMQKTGSFKFRGALNATKCELTRQASSTEPLYLVTHSSGNHAQAVALAAQMSSTPERPVQATIVMPSSAPAIKQAGVRRYGGKIVLVENTNEAREKGAEKIVMETGASFIHPSEDPRVIAGQGTASLELLDQLEELGYEKPDAVIIPVGGGGLACGNIIALRGLLGDNVKVQLMLSL